MYNRHHIIQQDDIMYEVQHPSLLPDVPNHARASNFPSFQITLFSQITHQDNIVCIQQCFLFKKYLLPF